ncbi:MAG: hypothetical protein LBQ50_07280 [Planctomycetaceae bacterium]|jgi:uncharacterized Zn finger protein (UPF0148 family)|nr:hypothetical protein [Planctomycetaceae bacterium]
MEPPKKCPQCGAVLPEANRTGFVQCEFCGITVKDDAAQINEREEQKSIRDNLQQNRTEYERLKTIADQRQRELSQSIRNLDHTKVTINESIDEVERLKNPPEKKDGGIDGETLGVGCGCLSLIVAIWATTGVVSYLIAGSLFNVFCYGVVAVIGFLVTFVCGAAVANHWQTAKKIADRIKELETNIENLKKDSLQQAIEIEENKRSLEDATLKSDAAFQKL